MTNLDSILKSRDITDKGPSSQAMVFPVVVYECTSWTIKKVESQRIDAFELCWRRREESYGLQDIKPLSPKGNQS